MSATWPGIDRNGECEAWRTWTVVGLAIALFLVFLANLGRFIRWLREQRLRAHPERSPEQAAAMWYERMARSLARKGVRKFSSQTPQEFVQRIDDARLREPVAHFTGVYESARFGNSAEDARRLPELYEAIEAATRS